MAVLAELMGAFGNNLGLQQSIQPLSPLVLQQMQAQQTAIGNIHVSNCRFGDGSSTVYTGEQRPQPDKFRFKTFREELQHEINQWLNVRAS